MDPNAPPRATLIELTKIAKDDVLERREVLAKLLDEGRIDDEVIRAVIGVARQRQGRPLYSEQLVSLFAIRRSPELYWLTKNQLFADRGALIDLFETGYPDPTIEHELAELLLGTYHKNDDGLRTRIVTALRDHGTRSSLRALEDVLTEQRSVAQVKKLIAGGVSIDPDNPELDADWLKGKLALDEAGAEAKFVELLRTAITAIKTRDGAGFPAHAPAPIEIEFEPNPLRYDEVNAVISELKAAAEYYVNTDPETSLFKGRKALERIGKTLCREHGLQRKNSSLNKMQLGPLLDLLTEKNPITQQERNILPPLIEAVMRACNEVMPKGIHDNDAAEALPTSRRVAQAALLNLEEVIEWFIGRHDPPSSLG